MQGGDRSHQAQPQSIARRRTACLQTIKALQYLATKRYG